MSIVTVTSKFEVVIPQQVRKRIGIAAGDRLVARAEKGRVVLEPKSGVTRGVAQSMADFRAGRTCGPFENASAAVASIKSALAKPAARRRTDRAS